MKLVELVSRPAASAGTRQRAHAMCVGGSARRAVEVPRRAGVRGEPPPVPLPVQRGTPAGRRPVWRLRRSTAACSSASGTPWGRWPCWTSWASMSSLAIVREHWQRRPRDVCRRRWWPRMRWVARSPAAGSYVLRLAPGGTGGHDCRGCTRWIARFDQLRQPDLASAYQALAALQEPGNSAVRGQSFATAPPPRSRQPARLRGPVVCCRWARPSAFSCGAGVTSAARSSRSDAAATASMAECGLVGLGRLGGAADLADVLQRGRPDLVLAGRRLEVVQLPDVPAHVTSVAAPRKPAQVRFRRARPEPGGRGASWLRHRVAPPDGARRSRMRTASMRFSRTDSTRIE